MPKYLGALTIVLLLGMVLTRISVLRRQGIKAMKFGNMDKTDFLIPPFALFYFYVLFAAAFDWPTVTTHQFFHSEIISRLSSVSAICPSCVCRNVGDKSYGCRARYSAISSAAVRGGPSIIVSMISCQTDRLRATMAG